MIFEKGGNYFLDSWGHGVISGAAHFRGKLYFLHEKQILTIRMKLTVNLQP